jgi:hypothetical protein
MRAEVIWPVVATVGVTERSWAVAKLTATGGGDELVDVVGAAGAGGWGLQAPSSRVAAIAADRERQRKKRKENRREIVMVFITIVECEY